MMGLMLWPQVRGWGVRLVLEGLPLITYLPAMVGGPGVSFRL